MLKSSNMSVTSFFEWLWSIIHDITIMMFGWVIMVIGYFTPIKDVINVVVFFFVVDMWFGYRAAKKLRGESFSKTIIFNTTVPRLLYSVVILMLLFIWDTVFEQSYVSSYKLVGWFLTGVLIASILKNIYKITNWEVIPGIGTIIKDTIKKTTAVEVTEKHEETDNNKQV